MQGNPIAKALRPAGRVGLGLSALVGLALGLSTGAGAAAQAPVASTAVARLTRAGDGAPVAPGAADHAIARDSLVARLDPSDRLTIAGFVLVADQPSRAMISLSTEFLTVVVTYGRLRIDNGPGAGAGQALLAALDGNRIQRLSFNAGRLAATLSPGARPVLGADLETLIASQRRGRFWGAYEPLRVNARAPGGAAVEDLRQSYLAEPAIVRQRRAAVGMASVAARGRMAVDAFLAAYAEGDSDALAALLDPAPFLSRGGMMAVDQGRRQAASALLSDARLRPVLGGSSAISMAGAGSAAILDSSAGRWRLVLVPRDRAIFIQSLEPIS